MNTTNSSSTEITSRHLLINRNFALLWSGQAISTLGDFVFNTTLVVWIAIVLARGYAWTPIAVSGIFLAATFPTVLIGPLAGVFVDRWQKRRTMLVINVLQACFIAFLLLQVSITGIIHLSLLWQLSMIYLVVFLLNTCQQFFGPSTLALINSIVEKKDQPRAIGLGQLSSSIATLVGPVLAPPLLLAFGVQWALLFNMLSFVVSFSMLLLVHSSEQDKQQTNAESTHFFTEFRVGLVYLLTSQMLRTLLAVSFIAMLGGGILFALDIFFVTQNLHTPPSLYGVLDMAVGAGAILGAILASIYAQRLGLTRTLWMSVMALGVGILIYARLSSFLPAIGVLFLTGIPFAALDVASGPLLLRATPEHLIGRITALFNPIVTVATLVSSASAGYLDSVLLQHFHVVVLSISFGPVDTIFTVAGLLLLISGIYAMVNLRGNSSMKQVLEAQEDMQYEKQEV
ncbi:MAG TPA: MFS transporter [Ktedonobacter sp.]|nr:MFS transporter [Ktedonobacter sp.]